MLGSILIYAVSGLVDVKRVKGLASSDKKGLAKWLVFFGLDDGARAGGGARRVGRGRRGAGVGRLIFRLEVACLRY